MPMAPGPMGSITSPTELFTKGNSMHLAIFAVMASYITRMERFAIQEDGLIILSMVLVS